MVLYHQRRCYMWRLRHLFDVLLPCPIAIDGQSAPQPIFSAGNFPLKCSRGMPLHLRWHCSHRPGNHFVSLQSCTRSSAGEFSGAISTRASGTAIAKTMIMTS